MADQNEAIVCEMLRAMQAKGVELTKINLQKTAFFLKSWGVSHGLRFKPYTYGPYSKDLAKLLDDLTFWDSLKLDTKTTYSIVDLPEHQLSEQDATRIRNCVDALYDNIAGSRNPDFNEMEVLGTVLYCRNALLVAGEEPTEPEVINQFKAWKGQAYTDERIADALRRIENNIPQ
ncbi:YwgA family protein [Nitratidesulfovibrio vulgaris]|uniref:Antitoxin SocA-like Panacea domain-containing protein n=1 Tax=Nitratidesulfovibrio vulgaris (strain ATCC 29579 / DSM 644 / CCUG 34227 / NCIMB 8303 / VKM B-1760 / Hildenborough) TaxID=882 RepID=Q727L6_NITV2|nr:hypothetical protein [Nitratidesulfovibrio vulgaris]AAS97311.1 conserved hypothetical protein [Nitratidesulfovibrio vulgaris str. Hildenborough]ADP87763.1 hypothetical protein Deval_2621 [Nitratidesulfovibrio vulgaris RCH1]